MNVRISFVFLLWENLPHVNRNFIIIRGFGMKVMFYLTFTSKKGKRLFFFNTYNSFFMFLPGHPRTASNSWVTAGLNTPQAEVTCPQSELAHVPQAREREKPTVNFQWKNIIHLPEQTKHLPHSKVRKRYSLLNSWVGYKYFLNNSFNNLISIFLSQRTQTSSPIILTPCIRYVVPALYKSPRFLKSKWSKSLIHNNLHEKFKVKGLSFKAFIMALKLKYFIRANTSPETNIE